MSQKKLSIFTTLGMIVYLMVNYSAIAQSSADLDPRFDSWFTPLEDITGSSCEPSSRLANSTLKPLTTEQMQLLEELYINADMTYPPSWKSLAVDGSHYWNVGGFLSDLKTLEHDREGVLFVYQVPFTHNPALTQDWAWSSDTELQQPDIEIHIHWCRPINKDTTRTSVSNTFMVRHDGQWKFFAP